MAVPNQDRIIFHCDNNGFYASVEEVLYPELKKVPMAVCGDPEARRGIILAKNELAKAKGVKTAEPSGRLNVNARTSCCAPAASSIPGILRKDQRRL